LSNSVIAHNRAKWDGGGIEIVESTAFVRNSQIYANSNQGAGGGIHISDQSTATVEGNRIWENITTGWAGGGMFVGSGSSATISANEILSNTVKDNGGGIIVFDETTEAEIQGNIIRGNRARGGGGIEVSSGAVNIHSNTITNNVATEWSGAGLKLHAASASVSYNTIAGNQTSGGDTSGIEISGDSAATVDANTIINNGDSHHCVNINDNTAPVILTNNVIANNGCVGVIIHGNSQNVTITNNTISAGRYDGILVWGPTASASLIRNNIVTDSNFGINAGDGGTIVRMDHNNAYGNRRGDYNYDSALSEANNISQDPRFVDAANGDYRLRFGSPSIDSGTAVDAPDHDVLGTARPQGSGLDMGAYEMSYPKIYLPSISTAASWTPR
jgi:hypothetical protein